VEAQVNHHASDLGTAQAPALLLPRGRGEQSMPKKNSVGIAAGLAFVALFLVMIASIQGVAKFTQVPSNSYALAGNSKPTK
jgi:hypothetical protein